MTKASTVGTSFVPSRMTAGGDRGGEHEDVLAPLLRPHRAQQPDGDRGRGRRGTTTTSRTGRTCQRAATIRQTGRGQVAHHARTRSAAPAGPRRCRGPWPARGRRRRPPPRASSRTAAAAMPAVIRVWTNPGRTTSDPGAGALQRVAEALGERVEAGLGRAVDEVVLAGPFPGDRREHDEGAVALPAERGPHGEAARRPRRRSWPPRRRRPRPGRRRSRPGRRGRRRRGARGRCRASVEHVVDDPLRGRRRHGPRRRRSRPWWRPGARSSSASGFAASASRRRARRCGSDGRPAAGRWRPRSPRCRRARASTGPPRARPAWKLLEVGCDRLRL